MATAGASYNLAYRFYAAASYVGFNGSSSDLTSLNSKSHKDVVVLLYGLYQQATVGPCNIPKPEGRGLVQLSKWTSWHAQGNLPSAEAMGLFVKILEEEDPAWYSRVPECLIETAEDVEMDVSDTKNPNMESLTQNGDSLAEPKTTTERISLETQDKDVVSNGIGSVDVYDQWVAPVISGQHPKARYEHGAAVVHDKMYIFGGNCNGRYLNDIQVLDLRSLAWSKLEVKSGTEPLESSSPTPLAPCARHSLIPWENKLLSVAGHTKNPSESVTVKAIDLQTQTWSTLNCGKAPASRGGQSVTRFGTRLVMFGGEDAKRTLFNDLHILDLESLLWDYVDAMGVPPSPRSDHIAAVHEERYLLIFGGVSHGTCLNDLHVLDMQTMEWSKPIQKGEFPVPRAGHAGVTVGERWFIVGGGDNKSGVPETMVLNMSTLVWSVLTTVQGQVPMRSEGLSLVLSSFNGEDVLLSFGGYNGCYSHEVNVLKPSRKSITQSNIVEENPVPGSAAPQQSITSVARSLENDHEAGPEGKIREIVMDSADVEYSKSIRFQEQFMAEILAEIEAEIAEKKSQSQRKQKLAEAETQSIDKELHSVLRQLASQQSICHKLGVDDVKLQRKLRTMETKGMWLQRHQNELA